MHEGNEKISVCVVSQSFLPYLGGLTRYVNALGKRFLAEGHEFRVIHFKTQKIPSIDFTEGIQLLRVNIEVEESVLANYLQFKEAIVNATHGMGKEEDCEKRFRKGFAEYLKVNGEVYEHVKEIYRHKPFDVLHIHDFQLLPQGLFLENDLPTPMPFTWHIPFTDEMPDSWKKFLVKYMDYYDKIVFSTSEYVETAVASGLSREKVVKINPFIDLSEYAVTDKSVARKKLGKKIGVKQKDVMILCVSRIDPRKGQEVLVKAMKTVAEKHSNAKCVFVGNGSFSQELLKKEREKKHHALLDLVNELGLMKNIVFTGHLSEEELHQAYSAADIVVQPSLHEGFGLTVAEGMAFGKPVVGSRVGGIPEQIIDGENGFLFEARNEGELAEKLLTLVEDSESRKKMGERGLQIVKERFSVERGFAQHLELYRKLLDETT